MPLGSDCSFLQRGERRRYWDGCGFILLSPHTWLWEQAKGKMSLGDVHRLRKGGARQRISPSKASKPVKSVNVVVDGGEEVEALVLLLRTWVAYTR